MVIILQQLVAEEVKKKKLSFVCDQKGCMPPTAAVRADEPIPIFWCWQHIGTC